MQFGVERNPWKRLAKDQSETFVTVLLLSPHRFSTTSAREDQMLRMHLTVIRWLMVIVILGMMATTALAQPEAKAKRLRPPVTIRALVGRETDDIYVVQVRKGRLLSVQISWKKEKEYENVASFNVTASPDGLPVSFGKRYNGGRKWMGKAPKTGDYFIGVGAHPFANYVLKVTVKP